MDFGGVTAFPTARVASLVQTLAASDRDLGGGLEAAPEWLREQLPPLDLTQQKHRRRFEDMLLS